MPLSQDNKSWAGAPGDIAPRVLVRPYESKVYVRLNTELFTLFA